MKSTYSEKEIIRILITTAKEYKEKLNSVFFYEKCLSNTITWKEIRLRKDGTTRLKLEALPKLITFLQFSKMTVLYNKTRPKLSVDRLAGTTNYCLGFTKEGKYYVPSSCLLEDIRTLGDKPSQILAILSKNASNKDLLYNEIRYIAKGIDWSHLNLPQNISEMILIK